MYEQIGERDALHTLTDLMGRTLELVLVLSAAETIDDLDWVHNRARLAQDDAEYLRVRLPRRRQADLIGEGGFESEPGDYVSPGNSRPRRKPVAARNGHDATTDTPVWPLHGVRTGQGRRRGR